MSLDEEVQKAVTDAVAEHSQPEKVARVLLGWLNQLSLGQTDLGRTDETDRFFEALQDAIKLEVETENDR